MSAEANKAVVREFVEEVQGKHRLELLAELIHPNYVDHVHPAGRSPEGAVDEVRDTIRRALSGMLRAFPDLEVTIDEQIAEGDRVVTRKTFRGTHQGELWGQPPTGKRIEFEVIDIFRVADGKIIELWAQLDVLSLARKLGLRPPG